MIVSGFVALPLVKGAYMEYVQKRVPQFVV